MSPVLEQRLHDAASASVFAVFRLIGSSPRGLTEDDVARRQQEYGDNATASDVPAGSFAAAAARSPFVGLLGVLAIVFVVVGDVRGAVTLAVMVIVSIAVRRWQQTRSERAVRALRARVGTTVTVRRRAGDDAAPREREVPPEEVVPGDVLILTPGELVPADVRLVTATDLLVDQAVLTGEGLPVAKSATPHPSADGRPEAASSLCLAGAAVVAGTALAVVVATGRDVYSAVLARDAAADRPESAFDRGVREVSRTLVRFMLVMVPLVLAVNGTVAGNWGQALLFAAAVAVGLTPEMLPVVVTTTLARGARRLADAGVVVTRLNAVQDLGAADVLCLDKTGTLTEERLVATHSIDAGGRPDDMAADHAVLAVRSQLAPVGRLDEAVLTQLGDPGDRLDEALYTPVGELGFDHHRRRASVEVRRRDGERLLITKGDPDDVLPRCDRARYDDQVVDLDRDRLPGVEDLARAHAEHGLRLLAVAVRSLTGRAVLTDADECHLVLVGFVAFADPVRPSAPDAVRRLAEHGVDVLMLTGDNPRTAARVATRAGIDGREVAQGRDVDAASDAGLDRLLGHTRVFARVTPLQKARIVESLRRQGRAVGFVGDGVNDVPALRLADVGIVADTAAPAAKRAADLILTDPDLGVLAAGVVEGRRTLGNTLKYVTITASSNFGNAVTLLAASVFLPFLPMLPLQLVVQNLLYDASQLALPWDRVDPEYERGPRRWDTTGLVRFMLLFGPLSSLFDLATFGVLWWGFHLAATPAQFRAGWFVEGLISQLLVVLVLRTRGSPLRRRPRPAVVLASATAALLGLLIALTPAGHVLALDAPPPLYLGWLVAVVAGYGATAQLAKLLYLRRRGRWP